MEESDLSDVLVIEKESFSTPWSAESFLSEIYGECSACYVAVTSDQVVAGYTCTAWVPDEGYIYRLAVRTEWRRRGVGRTLTDHILKEMELLSCRNIYLEVRRSNYKAIRLYESFGFRVCSIRKRYYRFPDEDAVLMLLELKD
jgi:ribosomal-protein-alanine N-acetyltransferase